MALPSESSFRHTGGAAVRAKLLAGNQRCAATCASWQRGGLGYNDHLRRLSLNGHCESDNPPDDGPAEQQVDDEYGSCVGDLAAGSDNRWNEVDSGQDDESNEGCASGSRSNNHSAPLVDAVGD